MLDSLTLAVLGSDMSDPKGDSPEAHLRTMAIHRTHTQSDLEKRLQVIRKQVYGKTLLVKSGSLETNPQSNSDITYLRHDLIKISILTSLALGSQIVLFYLVQNNVLKLNFF